MFYAEGIVEAGRKTAGTDAAGLPGDVLGDAAVGLAQHSSLVALALSHLGAELEAQSACDREYGLSTAAWLARETGLPRDVTCSYVKVGVALRTRFREVDAAVLDGRITWHHAKVLVDACNPRVIDTVVGIQGELIALAEATLFGRWRREVRGIIELLDQDGAFDPNEDLARNTLSVSDTLDGVTHLNGQLVGEYALGVTTTIDQKADELFRRFTADHEQCADVGVPARSVLRALGLYELCRAGLAVDLNASRPPRTEITLVIQAEDPDVVTGPNGVRLADGTTRAMRCDADLFALVRDSLGVTLDMGHAVRLAPPAIKRAMGVRDGGCVYPGCTLPANWCDAHHVDHHRLGGHTDIARMALLCRHHHGVTHRKHWQMFATDDQWFWWRTPTGRTFWSQRHHRQRPGPGPLPDPDRPDERPRAHAPN